MLDWLLLAAAIIGLLAGGFLVARSPTFWFGLALVTFNAAKPHILKYISTPQTPENQKKLEQSRRRAEEWDNFNKRPRDR